ncbi:hypothetical protein ACWKWV_07335 [Castellaniella ginsengisoli]
MAQRRNERATSLKTVLISVINGCLGWRRGRSFEKVDLLLTCHDVDRGSIVDGKPYAQITDSFAFFAEMLGYSTLTIAKPYSMLVGHRAHGCPVSINGKSLLMTLLSYSLLGIQRRQLVLTLKTRMWINLLRKTRPKLVVGVQPSEDLCAACKILGIKVYDAQHGVINSQHPWYTTRIKMLEKRLLPNGFLVWDETSKHGLSAAKEKGLDVLVIGHPEFIRYRHEKKSRFDATRIITEGQRPVHVLITLQWGLGDIFSAPEEKGLMGNELIRAIKNSDEKIKWHIRMHPVQMRKNYKKIYSDLLLMFGDSKKIDIDDATLNPLPIVLSSMDLHITYHSTVVIEAGWMGIPSAILCPYVESGNYSSYYQSERKSGIAECVKYSEIEICEWIDIKANERKNLNFIPMDGVADFLSINLR